MPSRYLSARPTKTGRRLHGFMEANKHQGVVGARKLADYLMKKNLTAAYTGKSEGKKVFKVGNKNGTMVAGLLLNPRTNKVDWWYVK